MKVLSEALSIDHVQVWRVLTGGRTPRIGCLLAMHENLGADTNVVLSRSPAAKWFRPLTRRRVPEWE